MSEIVRINQIITQKMSDGNNVNARRGIAESCKIENCHLARSLLLLDDVEEYLKLIHMSSVLHQCASYN